MDEVADAAHIATTGAEHKASDIELQELLDPSRVEVDNDGVINLDVRVWVADGAAIVSDNVWDGTGSES